MGEKLAREIIKDKKNQGLLNKKLGMTKHVGSYIASSKHNMLLPVQKKLLNVNKGLYLRIFQTNYLADNTYHDIKTFFLQQAFRRIIDDCESGVLKKKKKKRLLLISVGSVR